MRLLSRRIVDADENEELMDANRLLPASWFPVVPRLPVHWLLECLCGMVGMETTSIQVVGTETATKEPRFL